MWSWLVWQSFGKPAANSTPVEVHLHGPTEASVDPGVVEVDVIASIAQASVPGGVISTRVFCTAGASISVGTAMEATCR